MAEVTPNPPIAEARTRDPNDDYVVALGQHSARDVIGSGDADLFSIGGPPEVLTPRELLDRVRGS